MANKRTTTRAKPMPKKTTAPPAVPDVLPGIPDDVLADNERDALQLLLGELAGVSTARVTVYRATRNQPQRYMFQCTPDAFSLDDLRDKFNGGEFRVYISRDGRPWKNVRVNVEPPEAQEPEGGAVADLAIAMREGFERQGELIRDALTARPSDAAGVNLPALITALATAMRPAHAPAPAPAAPAADPLAMLRTALELAKEFREAGGGGAGENGAGLMDVVRELAKSPLLGTALAAFAARPQAPGPASSTAAGAAAAQPGILSTAPAPGGAQPAQGGGMFEQVVKHYLGMLVRKAAEGSDPTLYADLVLDNAPEDKVRQFFAASADPVAELAKLHPGVAEHRDWFTQLADAIKAALAGDATSSEG